MVEADTKVYYSSPRFREVQIYQLLHNEELIEFPTASCFFVTENYTSSLLYSKIIRQPKIFFQNSEQKSSGQSHDVTHVYRVKGRQTTVQLNDPKTLQYILFDDLDSPFHLSKAHENLLSIDIFSTRGPKGWPSLEAYRAKHKVIINSGSGFALILGATNYMNYELYGDDISRVSFCEVDYTIIKLLKDYLTKVNPSIQGWCQPAEKFFHQEYMFFDPHDSLIPVYGDPRSWLQKIEVCTTYPKIKKSFLRLLKFGEERLGTIKATHADDLSYLKLQVRRLSGGSVDAMFEANLELQQEVIKKEERLCKENTLTHLVPYLSTLYHLRSKFNKLQEIFFIDNNVKCHLEINCIEPFGFERCQQNLKTLVNQMRLYSTSPNHHHKSKSVADHAIWVARTVHKWFQYEKHPWTEHIWQEFQNITILAAFLHDIGKIGDLDFHSLQTLGIKEDHPFRGYEYILSKLLFRVLSADQKVSHHKLLDYLGCTFNTVDVTVLALVIALHHYFGRLLISIDKIPISKLHATKVNLPFSLNKDHYKLPNGLHPELITTLDRVNFKQVVFLHQLLQYLKEVDHRDVFIGSKANLVQLIHIIFAVSAADTYGAFPVDLAKMQEDDAKILEPQFIYEETSNPEVSVVIDRPFYKYLYHTVGLQQKFIFLLFVSKVVNLPLFLAAWNNFNIFIGYLERCLNNFITVEVLPYPYTYLRQNSLAAFLEDLFNLLETGYVNEQVTNQVLDAALGLELSEINIGVLDDPLPLSDIILDLEEFPSHLIDPLTVQYLPNNLVIEFQGTLVKKISYGNAYLTLEKYLTNTQSLFPDVIFSLVDKVQETTLSTVSLKYVRDQLFSIRQIRYDKISYLSDLMQTIVAFIPATIIYEDTLDEGPLRHLLGRYQFDMAQTHPVRGFTSIIMAFDEETNNVMLHIHYMSLELLHNLSRIGDVNRGYFEVDQSLDTEVTLNASKVNFELSDAHKSFPFRLTTLEFIAADDLNKIIMSYIQGPTSTLTMFIFTLDGMWSVTPTIAFQTNLIMMRDLVDHTTVHKVISQLQCWYDNYVQRFNNNNYTFLDAINNLTGDDLMILPKEQTLFKVNFIPWSIISLEGGVRVPLKYKIDPVHNIGPLFTPTFKINLFKKLLFQNP